MREINAYASQALTLKVDLRQGGSDYTGKTIVVDIAQTDGTLLVNNGSCTEGMPGIYYYAYTTPSTEQSLTVKFYEGAAPVGDSIDLSVINTLASAASGDSNLFTTLNNMVTRVNASLANHNVPTTTALTTQYINEAVQYLQRRFTLLKDEFVYNITASTHTYQVDSVIPYPYEIEDVWYNTGSSEVPIIMRDRVVCKANVAASVATVTGYAAYKDTFKHYVQLNGIPAANITSGLRLKGPYMPLYVSAGQSLPIEKKYDEAVEAVSVEMAVKEYSQDPEEVKMVENNREVACQHVGLTETEDRMFKYASNR